MFFVDAVHLIEPSTFSLDDLRPAAYDVHIGDTYYVDDQPKTLGPGDGFKIRANGLVYVKTKENFNIPYYMVARYSLRVTQVYRVFSSITVCISIRATTVRFTCRFTILQTRTGPYQKDRRS